MKRVPGEMRAGGAAAFRGRGRDTWLGRYLGEIGATGQDGGAHPSLPGGTVSPSCVHSGRPAGAVPHLGPPQAPQKWHLCQSAPPLCSPGPPAVLPTPANPLPLPPSSPTHRGPGVRVNASSSSSSCRLGKPLGCPEAQCFHLYNGTPPCQHHRGRFWGAPGQGQCTPAQCPEHQGVPGTACPASPGVLAPCWVGKGGTGTQGDTRGDPDVCGSECDGGSEEEGQASWV